MIPKVGEFKKKKRVSKKKKISWRKVDISDVDNFLEEQRTEERLGLKELETAPDEQLFAIDTGAPTQKRILSKQEKRKLLREKPLKCHLLLKPLTNVPDPLKKRNRIRTKEEKMHPFLKKKLAENRAKGIFRQKELQSIKDKELDAEKRENRQTKHDFDKDIWDISENIIKEIPEVDVAVRENQWITGDAERHLLHGTGKPTKIMPKTLGKKATALKSIELPHPGMSYNPSYEDHQDLLNMIVEKEQKIIKEEKHIDRVTKGMFRRITLQQKDSDWLTEMSAGLPDIDKTPEEESDSEFKPINPPVENKKKSLKQRRKQKEQHVLQLALRDAKVEKKKTTDIHRLRFLKVEINKAEAKAKMLHEKRLKKEEYKTKEARRVGKLKFEEPDMDFNMANDIKGSLRIIKKEGNILRDRMKSLQKRNVIEPTAFRNIKKTKVKRFTRSGHKDDWAKTVARANPL